MTAERIVQLRPFPNFKLHALPENERDEAGSIRVNIGSLHSRAKSFWAGKMLFQNCAERQVFEIAFGAMIAMRRFAPRISALGSLGASFALVNTLSFLFTTPGLDPASADAGFLLKDLTLLGAALWTAVEALSAAARSSSTPSDLAAGHD